MPKKGVIKIQSASVALVIPVRGCAGTPAGFILALRRTTLKRRAARSFAHSQSGLTCSGNICMAQCTPDTLEGHCDATTSCNTRLGYECHAGRCRPPIGAIRVLTGQPCDQGDGNKRFW